jgi:hypothetical protein
MISLDYVLGNTPFGAWWYGWWHLQFARCYSHVLDGLNDIRFSVPLFIFQKSFRCYRACGLESTGRISNGMMDLLTVSTIADTTLVTSRASDPVSCARIHEHTSSRSHIPTFTFVSVTRRAVNEHCLISRCHDPGRVFCLLPLCSFTIRLHYALTHSNPEIVRTLAAFTP